ncbi:MAG: ABC transporter substrate-binding protein, partial [Pseudomonadota bacterium]|nr:ABC transporter substrate-binding protein [Pseudomonadota bacterium]
MKKFVQIIALIVSVAITSGAMAQKSKDTLRIGFADPISVVDLAYDPKPEIALTARIVFDGLVHYDDFTGKFYPLLAKSWKRINPKTMDFELRNDVKFHDGSEFDADDVVYTINWLISPK